MAEMRWLAVLGLLAGPGAGWAQTPVEVVSGPACADVAPFYWEIGDANAVLASGTVTRSRVSIARGTVLQIASASKWPYGAFVDEIRKGNPTADDLKFLNLRSGWTRFSQCGSAATVAACAASAGYVKRTDGKFDYGGGHMQKHAALNGWGTLTNATLAAKINGTLGTSFAYSSPQLAGGIRASAEAYATMLQRMMRGDLVAGAHLQDNGVPTQGAQAIKSPVPEPWSYGRGHWIEQDGTASSPGAFGFYPWISADKALYGIVASQTMGGAWNAVKCGREIRKAYRK